MKVFLLHPGRDFDVQPELRDEIYGAMLSGHLRGIFNARRELERRLSSGTPEQRPGSHDDPVQDLELETLWTVMAGGDEFLFEVAKRALLSSLRDPDEIVYRQEVLADCLEYPEIVRQLYELAIEALGSDRQVGGLWSGAGPGYILHRSVQVLKLYTDRLTRLRMIADRHGQHFRSRGFTRFFAMLRQELSDSYLHGLEQHLRELELKRGVLESAELGKGDTGRRYVFHKPPRELTWRERLPLIGGRAPEQVSFELHPRDEPGARYLDQIRGRGINHVANAAAQSADHVHSFFTMLRLELAFYLGCLNLHRSLERKGEPTCFPEPRAAGEPPALTARGLYDICLTLHLEQRVVGNEVNADGKSLMMITGANQGGKSTFLRSLGLAQLMMQCGMFVGAESFRASIGAGVFTHYRREEDVTLESGKLDEELRRMSAIADRIAPNAILLCNESFASTNEREGSEIAQQVVRAMVDKQIRVFFVTHMYELAHSFHAQRLDNVLLLRAEREPDGRRTFKLFEHKPLPTSYGQDAYRQIFGHEPIRGARRHDEPATVAQREQAEPDGSRACRRG
jgi:hypothetical protein